MNYLFASIEESVSPVHDHLKESPSVSRHQIHEASEGRGALWKGVLGPFSFGEVSFQQDLLDKRETLFVVRSKLKKSVSVNYSGII